MHIYCHRELSDMIERICRMTLAQKLTDMFGERICFDVLEDGDEICLEHLYFL